MFLMTNYELRITNDELRITNDELVMTMDKILVCVHTEADGSLARPALEAVGAAKGLADSLEGVGLVVGLHWGERREGGQLCWLPAERPGSWR